MGSLTKGLGLLACVVATSVACGASGDDTSADDSAVTASDIGAAFDVNDVSILFPLRKTGPYPLMRVANIAEGESSTPPGQQEFLSASVFAGALAAAKAAALRSGSDGQGLRHPFSDFFDERLRGLWQMVGLRFDPCAPGFSEAARAANPAGAGKCTIQLRLIAQPFRENQTQPDDFTMHLVFNLGVSDLASLPQNPVVQEATQLLAKVKDASIRAGARTSGQPLGVHPGLAAEAKSGVAGGAVGEAVKSVMRALLLRTVSRQIAFMGLQNGGPEPWTFFAGQVVNDTFQKLPQLPAHGQSQQTLSFLDPSGPVLQRSRLPVSTAPLFDTTADKLTSDQRQLAFKVENPAAQHFFNTDCISCHTSSSLTHDLSLGDKAEISARVKVPKNITGYVTKGQAQDSAWNVRNFGYFFEKASVSGRTVAETIDVVKWLNLNVRTAGALNGPGLDCTAVDDQVWKCFRDAKDNCLRSCAPAPKPGDVDSNVPVSTPPPAHIDPASPTASNDPCLNASIGGPPTASFTNLSALGSVGVALGGNDSACLSRLLGGAFVQDGLVLACSSPTSCIISLALDGAAQPVNAVTFKGDSQIRFRQFFRVNDDSFFETRATSGGALRVQCIEDRCSVMLATAGSLPEPPSTITRINAE